MPYDPIMEFTIESANVLRHTVLTDDNEPYLYESMSAMERYEDTAFNRMVEAS